MNICSTIRVLAATAVASVCLAATVCNAQTITKININGYDCPEPNSVTVAYTGTGTNKLLTINTDGCGTQLIPVTAKPEIGISTTPSGKPGDPVTIDGLNFVNDIITAVTIAGRAARIDSITPTQILTTVPALAAAGDTGGIRVTNVGNPGAGTFPFTVTEAPLEAPQIEFNGVKPPSGAPETQVTITGLHLTNATVKFGNLEAAKITNSRTQILVTVPRDAPENTIVRITVTTAAFPNSPAAYNFSVSSRPLAVPVITSTPTSGQAGSSTPVVITGNGFTGANVTIGGAPASYTPSATPDTRITTTVPLNARLGDGLITVQNTRGQGDSRAINVTAAGDVTIDTQPQTIPNPSKLPYRISAQHQGLNGAGPDQNAYAMDPTRCVTTPPLTRSWQQNVQDPYKSLDFFAMRTGEALTYKFRTGTSIPIGGAISVAESASSGANSRPIYMTLTTTPCDFDTTKVLTTSSGSSCYITGLNGVTMNWAISNDPALPKSYCILQTDTTYYLNVRFKDVVNQPNSDACPVGETCGGLLQFF